jgi:hypothetical protein
MYVPSSSNMALSTTEYKAFVVSLDHNAASNELQIGVRSAYEEEIFLPWTDSESMYAVDHIKLRVAGVKKESAYVCHFRKSEAGDMCVNNVGSFQCFPTYEEYLAVGFGGHTTNGKVYPNEVSVVTNDGRSCLNHKISNLNGRYSPGVQSLGTGCLCVDDTIMVHQLLL